MALDDGGTAEATTAGAHVAPDDDPYHLTPEGIRDPPKGWAASLKYLGPGLITSASIVGSGELIATTTMGAQAGFVLMWMVIFSCFVKVAVQVEFARWTVSPGLRPSTASTGSRQRSAPWDGSTTCGC